jgi:protein arginine kinase activator
MSQCQSCGKKATVHLTEIIESQQIVKHLCGPCAQKEGIAITAQAPISAMISNLVSSQKNAQEHRDLSCPQCNLTWDEFRRRGQFGCPNDYLAFGKVLENLIEHTQGGAHSHCGRVPQNISESMGQQVRLLCLRKDLQNAVEAEDYETAVRLRDEISKHYPN